MSKRKRREKSAKASHRTAKGPEPERLKITASSSGKMP